MLAGGVVMAALAYGAEYYSAVISYPYESGGRPLDAWTAFMLVPFSTGILVAAYLVITRRTAAEAAEPRAPFVVGLTVAVLMLVALPITNGGLNPARSTAAAILSPSWALSQLWLFWVAPLLGAALAALLFRAFGSGTPALDDEDVDEPDEEGDEPDEGETLLVVPA